MEENIFDILKELRSILLNKGFNKIALKNDIRLQTNSGDNIYIEISNLDKDQTQTYLGGFIRGVFSIDGFYFEDLLGSDKKKLQEIYNREIKNVGK